MRTVRRAQRNSRVLMHQTAMVRVFVRNIAAYGGDEGVSRANSTRQVLPRYTPRERDGVVKPNWVERMSSVCCKCVKSELIPYRRSDR